MNSKQSAIKLQKYNTRSRSDTSDTYLQKCSPNVVCYFEVLAERAIRLKSHF